jgi:phenylacetate-CoA ligase
MPMIRYRVNDCALPSDELCPCGRGYPLMQALEGRTTDNFYLANGDVVPGVAFTNRLIKVCPGITKMQLIQEAVDDFTIRFVPAETLQEQELEQVKQKFMEFVGGRVNVRLERVTDIERESSGKTRFAISRVKRPENVLVKAGERR